MFYAVDTQDRHLYAGMLERKRDDIVRGNILQFHTSIEDLLDQHIIFAMSGATRRHPRRGDKAKALHELFVGGQALGFDKKLTLGFALGVISKKTRDRLRILNTLRNKCSHNWLLNVPVRRGKKPSQKKPPLLTYENRDLHRVATMKDFVAEFSLIYLKLWLKYVDLD